MRNPRSSSRSSSPPGERRSKAWYREPWPWLLAAGPLIVVVASMATTVLAVKSDDGMVASDYYKQGLLVNQRLPKDGIATPHLAATLSLGAGGELRIHPESGDPEGDFLRVSLYHPASGLRETLTLTRRDDGDFAGTQNETRPGRWIATVESASWPLPVAMIERGGEVRVATSSSIRR
ncbi:MAG: FixH family protein [Burkholderiales bacterium]